MKYTLGELFCGAGGLALGAKLAGIQHGWGSDRDPDACATFAANIGRPVFHKDVVELDITTLPRINCFAYGFPCNDFSIVGEHKGEKGSYGGLYRYGIDVIDRFKPVFFVAENVEGLSSADGALERILSDLERSGEGYRLTPHLYKAEEYGVPQNRHRLIIVGLAKKLDKTFQVPKPSGSIMTARQALEQPPIHPQTANHERTKQSAVVTERLSHIKPGQNIWTADLPDHLKLNIKGMKMSQIYRRLHPDKPSYTLTASGGGGTHGYHYAEPRALTNRERARLQTFPDDFVFYGKTGSVRKQIGMAVPPELSRIIFTSILEQLA